MPKPISVTFAGMCLESWPCQHPWVKLHYDDGTEENLGHLGGREVVQVCQKEGIPIPAHFHYLLNDDGTVK